MKIYLTSRFGRRDEMRGYRDQLEALGHTIVSTWIDSTVVLDDNLDAPEQEDDGSRMNFADAQDAQEDAAEKRKGKRPKKRPANHHETRPEQARRRIAAQIVNEIGECDLMLAFVDSGDSPRGAATAEFGGALMTNKTVWLVGERRHVLHYYDVPLLACWSKVLVALKAREDAERIVKQQEREEEA